MIYIHANGISLFKDWANRELNGFRPHKIITPIIVRNKPLTEDGLLSEKSRQRDYTVTGLMCIQYGPSRCRLIQNW